MATVCVTNRENGSTALPRNLSSEAHRVLAYNQELVQFADAKAGTLILVNSVFIAATAGSSPAARALHGACLLAAAAAVVASLWVVLGAGPAPPPAAGVRDLVFFEDIQRRRWPSEYVRDFTACAPDELVEQILRRAHAAAGIAQRKFRAYAVARTATAGAALFWLLAHALALVRG